VLDRAGQKGTGKWTLQAALDLGVPIPTLSAAVDARLLSAMKEERLEASLRFSPVDIRRLDLKRTELVDLVMEALYCSKIIAYAQGMALLARASQEYNWDLKLDRIAAIWKGGCIIRARFLEEIRAVFRESPALKNLLLEPIISQYLVRSVHKLREVLGYCARLGIPVPAFAASLCYFDAYRSAELPQSLTQAQRDFFGAHTYERKDRIGVFHTDWRS